jgi:Methyltransferase domain
MKCIICGATSSYFFSKQYQEAPYDAFMRDIGPVGYYKCVNCGFVLSKTHGELSREAWSKLNEQFHHHLENETTPINQPPYAEQAMMVAVLGCNGVIDTASMLDYAAGYGTLSRMLEKFFTIDLPIFDPYVKADGSARYVDKSKLGKYKTVINSAMFEHVLQRSDLDCVNNLVADDGVLIIHTVVCENIPKDPNWFYLQPPVHTAFHTNKSMNILMSQWGYKSSIYCPQSKCWILFRDEIENVEKRISEINRELQNTWFIPKEGFVDYWKGF